MEQRVAVAERNRQKHFLLRFRWSVACLAACVVWAGFAKQSLAIIGAKEREQPAVSEDSPVGIVPISIGSEFRCSGTVIGPKVILTSASCVSGHEDVRAKIDQAGAQAVGLKCVPNPSFATNHTVDHALCIADQDINVPAERVSTDPSLVGRGSAVLLFGLGCRTPGGADLSFGLQSWGEGTVVESSALHGYFMVSGAALCWGDGGGAAMVRFSSGDVFRVLVGVNARSDLQSTLGRGDERARFRRMGSSMEQYQPSINMWIGS